MRLSTVLHVVAGLLFAGHVATVQAAPPRAHQSAPAVDIRSRAAMIMRADTGEVLYAKNADQTLPIASITKLMTAMVVLDAGQAMNQTLSITDAERDRLRGTSSRLAIGTRLTRSDLLRLALMSSENRAAAALLRNYPGGKAAGVAAMNRKARALGMTRTQFVEGTGLSGANRSTPKDLARLVRAAARYQTIRAYSTTPEYSVMVGRYRTQYRNTNPLVRNPAWTIAVTKTGYLNEAGRCLVMQTTVSGKPVVMVLMNSWGTLTRVGDAGRAKRWLEARARPTQLARQP
ncbi:MAG: D-alanyl-D-alanine endopeptidase [Immundisolibacter sp.]|uniref:D-alanyl-D-alanine endopeptidase n=1 Tax=Immundisolibacter sp. TaxID=1934948 RepID=UPI003D1071A4